jgi:hypothetical protein
MATPAVTNTLANGTTVDADDLNENFADLVDFLDDDVVHVDGSKAMTGILTLPASDPSTANQATRKSYVDAVGTTAAAALATHHGPSSTDHDDRYYTETEVNTLIGSMLTASVGGLRLVSGTTSVTFTASETSALSSTVTVAGVTTVNAVMLTPQVVAIAPCIASQATNQFTVQASANTAISATVTIQYLALCTV